MYGIAVLGVVALYFILCIAIAAWFARNFKRKAMVFSVAFVILNIPLSYATLVPMVALPLYCDESGFWLYVTPEIWISENIENPNSQLDVTGGVNKHPEPRIKYSVEKEDAGFNIEKATYRFIDASTSKVLAKKIEFSWHLPRPLSGGQCYRQEDRHRWEKEGREFNSLFRDFKGMIIIK